jgi:anti-sigma factor RsiW
MVECRDFPQLLYGFVAKELSRERQDEVERHLAQCAGCQDELRLYEETIRLARSLPPVPPPPALLERFKEALENDFSPSKPARN